MAMLATEGLADVEMDPEGNVMGLRRGTGPAGGPMVVLAAHQDTVFPEGTNVKVRREGTKLFAPVGDDTTAWPSPMSARSTPAKIKTRSSILFVGDVGEEGPATSQGHAVPVRQGEIQGHQGLLLDGRQRGCPRDLRRRRLRRYRVAFHGPGGHSYGAFGIVNPMAAMGRAVDQLYAVKVPANPRTTYAASVVGGGVSVNSIPADVWLEVDMRSESKDELAKIDARFRDILKEAAEHENASRDTRFRQGHRHPKS